MYMLYDFCETSSGLTIIKLIKDILNIVLIIAPIVLIVMITIDFGKNVLTSSEEDRRKNATIAFKRILACIAIFFVPVFVDVVMNMLGDMGVDYAKCISNATTENIEAKKLQEQQYYNTGSESSNDPSQVTPVETEENEKEKSKEKKKVNFHLTKSLIVIAHYRGNKISKATITIKDKNNKTLNANDFNFKINKPIAVISNSGKITAQFAGAAIITVSPKDDSDNKQMIKLTIIKGTYTKVKTIKTMVATDLKTGEKMNIPAGTTGTYNGSAMILNAAYKQKLYYHGDILKVGSHFYSVPYTNVKPYAYSISKEYSKEEAEEFVNSNNFGSQTKYLFWTNLGSQENYLFKKSGKKWKLYKSFDVNTGDVLGLSPKDNNGNCDGSRKSPPWAYGLGSCNSIVSSNIEGFHLDKQWKGHWISMHLVIFNHRDDNVKGLGAWHEGFTKPKHPKSHGCIRHTTASMIWIRDNVSKLGGSRIIKF